MSTSALEETARTIAAVAILFLAAALGLVVGNVIQGGGVDAGAGPEPRVAMAGFSLDALDAVRASRGDASAPADAGSATRPTPR